MSEPQRPQARPCGSTRLCNNGTLPAGPRPRAKDRLNHAHSRPDPRPSCRAEPYWLPNPSLNVPLRHRDDGLLSAILGEASLDNPWKKAACGTPMPTPTRNDGFNVHVRHPYASAQTFKKTVFPGNHTGVARYDTAKTIYQGDGLRSWRALPTHGLLRNLRLNQHERPPPIQPRCSILDTPKHHRNRRRRIQRERLTAQRTYRRRSKARARVPRRRRTYVQDSPERGMPALPRRCSRSSTRSRACSALPIWAPTVRSWAVVFVALTTSARSSLGLGRLAISSSSPRGRVGWTWRRSSIRASLLRCPLDASSVEMRSIEVRDFSCLGLRALGWVWRVRRP
ncbi:hypothetical protein V8E53_000785 [Lactarius tabidus]